MGTTIVLTIMVMVVHMMLRGKRWVLIFLAVTGFARVAIIAVPVVGLYLYGDRTYEEVREK